MNLTIKTALEGVGDLIRDQISPAIAESYPANMARMSGGLLRICASWVDDAAALRVEENADIRSLLSDAAVVCEAGELSGWLAEAAASADPGLKISELDRENHRLRGLLVATQARLEDLDGDAARAMDQRIWRLLEAIEAQRAPRE